FGQTRLRLDAALREAALDEIAEDRRRNLLQSHHGTGLVEGATRADHLFHQARLGAGKDVADLALMLRGRADRVLDAAAIEAVDRLELVERHDDGPLALRGEPAGQREH